MTKKILIGVGIVISVFSFAYSIYSMVNSGLDKLRTKYQSQGRDLTLQAMAQAADQKQNITVSIDGKVYNFVGINQADKPEPTPAPVPNK